MILKLALMIALALTAIVDARKAHIVNGKPATAHSKPWLLNLITTAGRFVSNPNVCSATLLRLPGNDIQSDIALTAAHCIGIGMHPLHHESKCDNNTSLFKFYAVVASDHDVSKVDTNQVEVKVIDGVCHHEWTPAVVGGIDLAVLKLEKPIKFTDTIWPVVLPNRGETLKMGARCNVAGWGTNEVVMMPPGNNTKTRKPNELRELDVEIRSDEECKKLEETYDSRLMYCDKAVNDGPKGYLCSGDSGTPLICTNADGRPTAYGIASFTNKVCDEGHGVDTTLFAKIEPRLDWIEKEIKRLSKV